MPYLAQMVVFRHAGEKNWIELPTQAQPSPGQLQLMEALSLSLADNFFFFKEGILLFTAEQRNHIYTHFLEFQDP